MSFSRGKTVNLFFEKSPSKATSTPKAAVSSKTTSVKPSIAKEPTSTMSTTTTTTKPAAPVNAKAPASTTSTPKPTTKAMKPNATKANQPIAKPATKVLTSKPIAAKKPADKPRKASAPGARPGPFAALQAAHKLPITAFPSATPNPRKRKAEQPKATPAPKRAQPDTPAEAALRRYREDVEAQANRSVQIIEDPLKGVILPEAARPSYSRSAFPGSTPNVDDGRSRVWVAEPKNAQRKKLDPKTRRRSQAGPVKTTRAQELDEMIAANPGMVAAAKAKFQKDKQTEAYRQACAANLQPVNDIIRQRDLQLRRLEADGKGGSAQADHARFDFRTFHELGAVSRNGAFPWAKSLDTYQAALDAVWKESRRRSRVRWVLVDEEVVLQVKREDVWTVA